MNAITIVPLTGLPEITAATPLADLLTDAADRCCGGFEDGDVLVVTSKVVSKAEGRVVSVDDDTAKAALALAEARRVLRRRGDLVITETPHGFVCANAGVDISNTPGGTAVLLPKNPDRSARRMRDRIASRSGLARFGVVVSDTFGRAWRNGLADVAIGVAGFAPVLDLRGSVDMQGRALDVTQVAIADEIAAAADLVKGKAHGVPAAVVRGLRLQGEGTARDLVRPANEDLFR